MVLWRKWPFILGRLESSSYKVIATLNSLICKVYWHEDFWKSNWFISPVFSLKMKKHKHSHPQLPKDFKIDIFGTQSAIYYLPISPPSSLPRSEENFNRMWTLKPSRFGHKLLSGVFYWLPRKNSQDALWNSSLRKGMHCPHPQEDLVLEFTNSVSLRFSGDPELVHLTSS